MKVFEEKVLKSFKNSSYSFLIEKKSRIGVAVSGGADSVSLLHSLAAIFGASLIYVITINHNIRAFEESMGDCLFVQNLCSKLGVYCEIVELSAGKVEENARERGCGIEEAARHLRYNCFDSFIQKNNLECLCLAHNLNDQLETLLMRFLQGSGTEGGGGITPCRKKYFRPLLEIERKDIEEYLSQINVSFRTDSTNQDESYLRNNIRKNLVPLLDDKFPGWKNSVLSGREKAFEDEKALSEIASSVRWTLKDENSAVAEPSIQKVSMGIFRRCIYEGLKTLKLKMRLSYGFIKQIFEEMSHKESFSLEFNKVFFEKKGKDFFIKKYGISKTEASFFCIIEEDCKVIEIPSCDVEIKTSKDGILLCNKNTKKELKVFCKFPCVIRSPVNGDVVLNSSGNLRDLNKILKNWHVTEERRKIIPVVEECGKNSKILAVAGSLFGYSDWIVKGNI